MVDQSWNRTPLPRFEIEATYHRGFGGTDEINAWANGLSQVIGRTSELPPQQMPAVAGVPADATRTIMGYGGGAWARFAGFALGGSAWAGKGLGTAFAFGNTDIDDIGTLRAHLGYLGVANYRLGNFEIASEIGVVQVKETAWDANPANPNPVSVIKEVRGISALLAYHVGPLTFSVDGMNMKNTWARGEVQHATVVSGGVLGEW